MGKSPIGQGKSREVGVIRQDRELSFQEIRRCRLESGEDKGRRETRKRREKQRIVKK